MINVLTGLSRALSEVGAVIIVGGNIDYMTRVMTTSIVLETSRGDIEGCITWHHSYFHCTFDKYYVKPN